MPRVLCACDFNLIFGENSLLPEPYKVKENDDVSRFVKDMLADSRVGPFNKVYVADIDEKLPSLLKQTIDSSTEVIVVLPENNNSSQNTNSLELHLLTNGYINIKKVEHKGQIVALSASIPNVMVGQAIALNLPTDKKNVWKLDMDDTNEGEMIDPEDLLDEDDFAFAKKTTSSAGGCGVDPSSTAPKPKRACKDCSCGLKELLQEGDGYVNTANQPKSSCGSCYLGDGFRCASCPYRGLPPFKPGEKVKLNKNMLEDDLI